MIELPTPLYVGNAATTGVTFSNPVPGTPRDQWPPVDPSTVTLTYVPGRGEDPVVWTYGGAGSIIKVSPGIYLAELDTTDLPGTWRIKWVGTGACAAVWVAGFPVTPQPF
jgi:hypothetical protein